MALHQLIGALKDLNANHEAERRPEFFHTAVECMDHEGFPVWRPVTHMTGSFCSMRVGTLQVLSQVTFLACEQANHYITAQTRLGAESGLVD